MATGRELEMDVRNNKNKTLRILTAVALAAVMAAGAALLLTGCKKKLADPAPGSVRGGVIEGEIDEIMRRDDFRKAGLKKRSREIGKYLYDAEKAGKTDGDGNTIVPGSVVKDTGSGSFIYTDSDGGLHVVKYQEDDTPTQGDDETEPPEPEPEPGQTVRDTKGLLLYALDGGGSQLEEESKALVDDLNDKGSECEMDVDVTVEDYQTSLADKDYVILTTHGSMLRYGYGFANESADKVPVLCTEEDITDANRQEYAEDITEQRIAQVKVIDEEEPDGVADQYWIMPSFFQKHYGKDGLDGAYVHMGSCFGFGGAWDNEAGEDHALAESFLSCGAEAVTGYCNSVFTYYDFGMTDVIMDRLLSGSDLNSAVDAAKETYGEDDRAYAAMKGWLEPDHPYYDSTMEKIGEGVAYLVIDGDPAFNFLTTGDTGDAKGSGYPVGEWVADDGSSDMDGLIVSKVVFNPDLTGYTVFSSGSFEFEYTIDDDGAIVFRDDTAQHREYKAVIDESGEERTLTLYDPDGGSELYYFDKFPDE